MKSPKPLRPALPAPRRRRRRFSARGAALPAVVALVAGLVLLVPPPAAAGPAPGPAPAPSVPFQVASADDLVAELQLAAPTLDPGVLRRAVSAAACAVAGGVRVERPILTVIDYSLPSTERRLWVFDLVRRTLLYHELVAHGRGSGANHARTFSNVSGSKQSSLGLFRTAETYHGKNGYSLRLDGLERGINHLARPRTIVIHGAWYVSEDFARQHGRLGRSWGCPALDDAVARDVIDVIAGGSLLYADHREDRGLRASDYLACSA